MTDDIYILSIESSCDDTSASVICNDRILSNILCGQDVHEKYGGVVPELASRAHQKNIVPVVDAALKESNVKKENLNAIAFTQGPGLIGSLLVGTSFAKSMALALDIPLIAVNHMQAHILAHFIDDANEKNPTFPFLCLTISGGHTQIVKVKDYFDMEILGETIDDAVGETYDKSAKMMGLSYPGGPLIDKLSQKGTVKYKFTKPKVKDHHFSFSGLKTAILYFLQKETKKNPCFIKENLFDICASIQDVITEILMDKIQTAINATGIHKIAIAGGVSANSEIRKRLKNQEKKSNYQVYIPKLEYTTDNAAMIAITAYQKYKKKKFDGLYTTNCPNLQIELLQ